MEIPGGVFCPVRDSNGNIHEGVNSVSTRRDFLKGASVAGAAVAGLSLARGAHAAGSDEIRVVLSGCGGRGTGAIRDFIQGAIATKTKVRVMAVSDAFEKKAKGLLDGLKGDDDLAPFVDENAKAIGALDGFNDAIATLRPGDVCCMAEAPGYRQFSYKAAVEAGMHVFMEKPCCTDAPGYQSLLETTQMAVDKKLVVACGLQRRHQASYLETMDRIAAGALGRLMYQRVYWNGGAIWTLGREPGQSEMAFQVNNWYNFCWLSGDHIVEQHVHNLDIANWVYMITSGCDVKDAHPVKANGMGSCQCHRGNEAMGQIFDNHVVEFTYADGTQAFSQCRQINNTWSNVSEYVYGTEGEGNPGGWLKGKVEYGYDEKKDAKGRHGNPYVQEHIDLLNAIKGDKDYFNDGWHTANASFTSVFGRLATYSGIEVNWDDAVSKMATIYPADPFSFDSEAPVQPGEDGTYAETLPVPGIYMPY